MKFLKIFWLELRASREYHRYHRSFEYNILEAQETHNLPKQTVIHRSNFNKISAELKKLKPASRWAFTLS